MYIKIQKLAENNVEIERIMLFFKKMYSYLETDARNHVSGCPTSECCLRGKNQLLSIGFQCYPLST